MLLIDILLYYIYIIYLFYAFIKKFINKIINVQDLRLPYVVSFDFWQYKVEVDFKKAT